MGLRIHSELSRHGHIGLGVDIEVANAIQMFEHGYRGLGSDSLNEPLASTRHDHVNQTAQTYKRRDGRSVGGINNLNHLLRQTSLSKPCFYAGRKHKVRTNRLRSAAQQYRVTRL